MENWKRWFQPRILERGREYFDEGRVQTVEHSGDGYSAVVQGTEDYEVEILLEGDSIQEMFCNCRYAEDWNYCKHMAAVLFAVTAGKAVPKKRVSQNTRITPETLAARIPDDRLRPLLAELMSADEKLYREMLLQYGGAGPDECARTLRKTLTGIKKRYADRGGYINYHDVKGYTAEIADFIKRQAASLITQNAPFLAFQLGLEAVQEYDRCGVDDSEGWSAMVIEAMEHLREQVLSAADEESASKIFDLLAGSYRPDRFDGLVRDFVEETLFSYFQDETSERKKLALADQWIATLEKTAGDNYSSEFEIQGLLVRRYDIMKELSMPEEERNAFLERYLNFSAVRKLYVQHMLDTGRPEEAARLLEEGKSVNQDRPGLVADYSERLIDVYAQLGRRDRLLKELEYHVLTLGSGGLEMLNRLKMPAPRSSGSNTGSVTSPDGIAASWSLWNLRACGNG